MLLNFIILAIYLLCTLLSLGSGGESAAAGRAVMEGAEKAVSFGISIAGGICLWSAVLELMERSGISDALARALSPVLGKLFPGASRDKATLAALSENVSANILGLGNAATPAGIRAAKGIASLDNTRETADELCLLVVLNTASIQLIPSTIATIRAAAGAQAPFDIMPAVWISSAISVAVGLLMSAWLRRVWK